MKNKFFRFLNLFGPFVGLLVVYFFFLLYPGMDSNFHSLLNTKSVLQQTVLVGIGALGMTMVIITAGIDLSAGSLVALASTVTALALRYSVGGSAGETGVWLPVLAAAAGIAACGFCGLLNGFMISVFGIVPFIVTLGMMQIARGVAKGIAGQSSVLPPPSWLPALMKIEPQPGVWYSVAPALWIMVGLTIACWVMLKYTTFGRHIYAVGSNEATARLCGINVGMVRILVYTIAGALTGVSGVMSFAVLNLGDPTGAIGMELDIIAAVVIGGGSFNGGEGSVIGSIIGAVIIALLRNGCVMIGVSNYVQNILIGTIIIVAVGVDQLKHRRTA